MYDATCLAQALNGNPPPPDHILNKKTDHHQFARATIHLFTLYTACTAPKEQALPAGDPQAPAAICGHLYLREHPGHYLGRSISKRRELLRNVEGRGSFRYPAARISGRTWVWALLCVGLSQREGEPHLIYILFV